MKAGMRAKIKTAISDRRAKSTIARPKDWKPGVLTVTTIITTTIPIIIIIIIGGSIIIIIIIIHDDNDAIIIIIIIIIISITITIIITIVIVIVIVIIIIIIIISSIRQGRPHGGLPARLERQEEEDLRRPEEGTFGRATILL